MKVERLSICLAGLGVIAALAACHTQPPLPEQRFELRGRVVEIDKTAGTVRLQHEAIPGYMAAMTMDYPVKDKWVLGRSKPGQTVQATLVVASDRAWLEEVVIRRARRLGTVQLTRRLCARPAGRHGGSGFTLIDQDGKHSLPPIPRPVCC